MGRASVIPLIALDRLPRGRPGDSIGLQDKPQFDQRSLRREHRCARARRGALRLMRIRLQQL